MAYTYDDFTKRASDAGMMDRFSPNDLATATKSPEYGISLLGLLQDSQNAKTGEQKILANEAANQLRKSYGVYSGEDGTAGSFGGQSVNPIAKTGSTGSFVYDNDSAYKQLLESIAKQQPFRYDLETDPSWAAYKKQYLREGDRASANAMAQASAASGGRPSSYAMNVAQQAGNYYAGALSDIIPTLEQDAYTRYLEDINNKMNGLGALQTDRNFDYENWLNEYNMRQQEYENAMALYKTLGYATPEVAEILGIKAASAESGTRNPGGGGSGNGGSTSDWGEGISDDRSASSGGVTGSSWALTKNNLQRILASGDYGKADRYVEQVVGQMNESQYEEMVALLERYGR